MRRCQFCQHLIDPDFGDPHLCLRCIDTRLDERFARWAEEREPGEPSARVPVASSAPR